jgi:hypothetical protein
MNKIKEIISKYPKHFSRMIKKDTELFNWVMTNTLLDINAPFPSHIYSAINQVTNICPSGNIKPYFNITDGFRFCDHSSNCACANASVSAKVSKSKSEYSDEKKIAINDKRKDTTLKIYGVTNNGQTKTATDAHKRLYQDVILVNLITTGIKKTKLKNHGDENYNNRPLAKETCLTRYGVENSWLTTESKKNPNLVNLHVKELLAQDYEKYTILEIAEKNNVHVQTVYRYLGYHGLKNPFKSSFEKEIEIYLKSLGVTNILLNKRTIIGKELDIYLPEYNLAIEYNGLYWHHDGIPHITKTYHYEKFKKCEEKGITLLTIFGNTWDEKKDLWKQKIKAKLQLAATKIFARKTKVVPIKIKDSKAFLDNNHIQGYCSAQIGLALIYNEQIVAVMTFSKKRPGIGKSRGDNAYELVRYATSQQVTGGASKLLLHFIKNYFPTLIYSYSDNQYSSGNLYQQLGFTLEQENKSGYRYYDPSKHKMFHRFSFTKSKLVAGGFSADKTEKEIMDDRGFLRIWDCGTRTWIYSPPSV